MSCWALHTVNGFCLWLYHLPALLFSFPSCLTNPNAFLENGARNVWREEELISLSYRTSAYDDNLKTLQPVLDSLLLLLVYWPIHRRLLSFSHFAVKFFKAALINILISTIDLMITCKRSCSQIIITRLCSSPQLCEAFWQISAQCLGFTTTTTSSSLIW